MTGVRAGFTVFLAVLVPVYWHEYGPANFLWFSDIALFAVLIGLWTGHPLPASMSAVGVLALELSWTLDFLVLIAAGTSLIGLAEYMTDPGIPIGVRALSLFHPVLPPLLLWMIHRLGYDRRAWTAQTLLALVVLPVTYALTGPAENINWVFGPGAPQTFMPPLAYLGLVMAAIPLLVYWPTHGALKWWCKAG